MPIATVRRLLKGNRGSLFETYVAIDEAIRNWDDSNPPWQKKKYASTFRDEIAHYRWHTIDMAQYSAEEQAALLECEAARNVASIHKSTLKDKAKKEAEEAKNFSHAKSIGQTEECGCCFEEFALNRMIQCNGDTIHWFCRGCMRLQAETNIGMSKHVLTCMSVDGCSAGFSPDQKRLFLHKKLRIALDRIEQQYVLREAGIANLVACPFCPFAAECPPVEEDREFRCVRKGCEKVSCRLCQKETHIPKSCEEAAADRGIHARHALEEAMTNALIRKCNNCK